jgi:hypothetical protein
LYVYTKKKKKKKKRWSQKCPSYNLIQKSM